MKYLIALFNDVSIVRVTYSDVDCYVVSYRGCWVPGRARTKLGAYVIAWRAHRGLV